MDIYEAWIEKNCTETYGRCAELTSKMQEVFPELTRVRGHYYCLAWGEREHWWLVDPSGNIVDPTKSQFPTKGTGEYVELDPNAPEPTGKCPECGEYCYDGNYFCCKSCEISYMAYIRSGIL